MDIQQEIRNIIMEVFNEAAPSTHFKDRVHDRLSSTMYTRPKFNYDEIKGAVDLIKRVNFPEYESASIQIKKYPVVYSSKDPETGHVSVGDELWAVVRDNVITTIFFRNSNQLQQDTRTDHQMSISQLKKFYDTADKNADGTVDFDTLEKKSHRQGKGQRKKVKLDFPTVEIGNAKWYIDEPNEELIYAKNTKKRLSFDDLKEEILEQVIDAVTVQSAV